MKSPSSTTESPCDDARFQPLQSCGTVSTGEDLMDPYTWDSETDESNMDERADSLDSPFAAALPETLDGFADSNGTSLDATTLDTILQQPQQQRRSEDNMLTDSWMTEVFSATELVEGGAWGLPKPALAPQQQKVEPSSITSVPGFTGCVTPPNTGISMIYYLPDYHLSPRDPG